MQIRLPSIALLAATLIRPVPAQVEQAGRSGPEPEQTSYHVDAISFAALNSPLSRVDVFVQVGFENLTTHPTLNARPANRADDQPHGNVQRVVKLAPEKVSHRGKQVRVFRRALLPNAFYVLARCLRKSLLNHEHSNRRVTCKRDFVGGILRTLQPERHVRLA